MAGTLLDLFPKQRFDFDNGSSEVVVAKAVPVLDWMSGRLLVRVHAEGMGGTSTIRVKCFITAPTAMDPAQDFVASSALAEVLLDRFVAAPDLLADTLSGNPGGYLRIVVTGNQTTGTCNATLSAALAMKE